MHRPAYEYPSAPPAWLPEWPAEAAIQALFAPGIRDYAARVLFKTPVRKVEWTAVSLFAVIGDQRPLWRLADGRWTRSCSCGYKDDRCVHLYALARCFQMAVRQEGWLVRTDGGQVGPGNVPRATGGAAGGPPERERGSWGMLRAGGGAPAQPSFRSPPSRSAVVSFGDDLFGHAAAMAAIQQAQRLEAEVDFQHEPGSATLRFYLVADGRRELLRIQDVYNLSYRVRAGVRDPGLERFPEEDRRLLKFLWSSLQEKGLCRNNLQVFKVPQERFAAWLEEWTECPARFLERSSQQPVNACGGHASALHFELRDAPEGQVEIAAIVTVPGGKMYPLHEIFQLLAGGGGKLVLDGKLLDFAPPVPWKLLTEFFSRKTPRTERRHVPELLPLVTGGRLDLVHGKIRRETLEVAPVVEVKPDGAALLVRVRLGSGTLFAGSAGAAGSIRADGDGWVMESYSSPHLAAARRLLRVEGAQKMADGWCRIPGDPRAVTAFLAAWDALPPGNAVRRQAAPELAGLLGGGRALVPELRLHESRGFVDMQVSWSAVSHHDLRDAMRAGAGVLRTRSGGWFRLAAESAGQAAAELDGWGVDDSGHCRMFAPEAGKALAKARQAQLPISLHPASHSLAERLRREPPLARLALPPELALVLRDYQRHGFEFLADRAAWNVGAVLADDMGLGKTLQVLALLQAFLDATGRTEERKNGRTEERNLGTTEDPAGGQRTEGGQFVLAASPLSASASASASAFPPLPSASPPPSAAVSQRGALVICPASVVSVWQEQAARFCPRLKCVAYVGAPEKRAALLAAGNFDLLVTNYALVRNDIQALAAAAWPFVILDEAQQIKNPDSLIAQAVGRLRTPRPLALTGTPLENRLLDLWSIMNFVNPGFLGGRDQFLARHDGGGWQRHGLSRTVAPVILRRLKETVATELPPRTEEVLRVEFSGEQQRIYDTVLVEARASAKEKGAMAILAALTRLRQACCDPRLLPDGDRLCLEKAEGKRQKAEGGTEIPSCGEGGGADLRSSSGSAKLDCLLELAQELMAEGHSMLVFSQFTQMLDLIETALAAAGIPTMLLTGETAMAERARLVREFNERATPCVFLLSLKAAGTGLTLTRADYVVIYDPWWNPAVERQAIDRTHRIGQTKPVIAYRLVVAGTVEEKILQMQQEKAELFAAVMADTERGGELPPRLTAEDLAKLLE